MFDSKSHQSNPCNVALRLARFSAEQAVQMAVACAKKGQPGEYDTITFSELDEQSNRIAKGLLAYGVKPGMRLAMLVPFGIDFIRLVLALLKAGVIQVLVDPGMGKKNLIECLAESTPDGFIGIPRAQFARMLYRRQFPRARYNIQVGGTLPFAGAALARVEAMARDNIELPTTHENDPAAVIFTTGSTGPPKGVSYTHGTFENQVALIQKQYDIQPRTVDLACFPLFGLFDAVMGVTTVVPDMDPTRPADINPANVIRAVEDWKVTQAFGSPALWHRVAHHCVDEHISMPTIKRVLSAGAPVPPETLAAIRQVIHPDAEVFTPYGATESLPVASIESREVLEETAQETIKGAGTCVGNRFPEIRWKVIRIDDRPLDNISQIAEVQEGDIGELMVAGPVISREYVTRTDQNRIHKVADGDTVWHRMGDIGYLDSQDRFWFCGRKSHRVDTQTRHFYTVCCEAVFNQHPCIYRSALVGVGSGTSKKPVIIVEPERDARPQSKNDQAKLIEELRELALAHQHTEPINDIRIYPKKLPVDIRHNSKIFREQLAVWAAQAK